MEMQIDKTTRVFIAGCGGMLGQAVHAIFADRATVKATDIDLNEPWLEYADVRDYAALERTVLEFSPQVNINLAALTDMERSEMEQDNAWLTNALGAENLGLLANRLDVPLVYISTAGIFGGEKDTFNDFDTPNPLSCYAKSKFAGELFVREHVRRYYVVRDKLGTPTYTHDFAKGLLRLGESDLYGVYNQACEGSCSRFDVAEEFVRMLGLEREIRINKVASDFFKAEYFAARPASEKLINMNLHARGLNQMRDWRVALGEYAAEFAADLRRHRR